MHELKTLVLSRHPAIAIETAEEERADALLGAVAADTRLSVFEWTVTQGLLGDADEPGCLRNAGPGANARDDRRTERRRAVRAQGLQRASHDA